MLAMPVHAAAMSDDSLCNLAGLYLALLDQARGEEAWQQISEITRLLIDQDRWLNQQQGYVLPMGPVSPENFIVLIIDRATISHRMVITSSSRTKAVFKINRTPWKKLFLTAAWGRIVQLEHR